MNLVIGQNIGHFLSTKLNVKLFNLDVTDLKIEFKVNNHMLEVVHKEKDLGIIIDNTLRFHQHTACMVKKANQVLE